MPVLSPDSEFLKGKLSYISLSKNEHIMDIQFVFGELMKGTLVFIENWMLGFKIGFLSITVENLNLSTLQKSRWKEMEENVMTIKGSFLEEFPYHEIPWVELYMAMWQKPVSCISY